MLITHSVHPRWLSNSWLVAAGPGSPAVIIDAGAPPEPLLTAAGRYDLDIQLVLLTHHHHDHVSERAAFAPAPCAMLPEDREHVPGCERELHDGERLECGAMSLTMLHVPGHTRGQLNVLVEMPGERSRVFTGDTLFRRSVGGTTAPGHGTFVQLRESILERLLELDDSVVVCPGHGSETSIGEERLWNPFIRAWSGEDAILGEAITVRGRPAKLLTWAKDYDDGFKAWVLWDDWSEDVVPGSVVANPAR